MPSKEFTKLRELRQKITIELFIKIVMFLISITAMAIEAQFDYVKIKTFVDPPFDAVLSAMLPLFTAFGFESAVILKKYGLSLMPNVIKAMAFLSMSFSLIMITAGQFEKNIDMLNQKIDAGESVVVNTVEYEFNLSERERITAELERMTAQSEEQQQKINKIEFNTWEYWSVVGEKGKTDAKIASLEQELKTVNNDIRGSLETGEIALTEKKDGTLYDIIGNMTGKSPEFIQLILFMVLPVFIVFMAPLGMYFALGLYESGKVKPSLKKPAREKSEPDWKELIIRWIDYNWKGLRINNYYHILPEDSFFGFVKTRGETFNKAAYQKIMRAAIRSGVVDENGNIVISDQEEAAEKIKKIIIKNP